MKRIWILEELGNDSYPEFPFEELQVNISFCYPPYPYSKRIFKILGVVPTTEGTREGSTPKIGFDEW